MKVDTDRLPFAFSSESMTRKQGRTDQIVIVTGMSGSGKHTVFKALEDLGYFCVDNLPPSLLLRFIEMGKAAGGRISKLAVVTDVRSGETVAEFEASCRELRKSDIQTRVVFVDASDEVLARRYSETRRVHPLAQQGSLLDGVRTERRRISAFKQIADLNIDTSHMSVHELRDFIQETFSQESPGAGPQLTLMSFGFRHGLPFSADLVFDVRFLPNPYFETELKNLPGDDPGLVEFFARTPETEEAIDRFHGLLEYLLPKYKREGKKYLTVAIGCTGGFHRSIYVCQQLAERITASGFRPLLQHRDRHRHHF